LQIRPRPKQLGITTVRPYVIDVGSAVMQLAAACAVRLLDEHHATQARPSNRVIPAPDVNVRPLVGLAPMCGAASEGDEGAAAGPATESLRRVDFPTHLC
jgi:hypothetical protein